MSGDSKMRRDLERWRVASLQMPEGWTRYPLDEPTRYPFSAIPDDVDVDCECIVMVEYRPSSLMGHGAAAVWVGPKDES